MPLVENENVKKTMLNITYTDLVSAFRKSIFFRFFPQNLILPKSLFSSKCLLLILLEYESIHIYKSGLRKISLIVTPLFILYADIRNANKCQR